ncbi:MAG TPA: lysylphosphatidylglycerol synthase transmembrane domain-containing protein, partial [Gemmataceae bacterium]
MSKLLRPAVTAGLLAVLAARIDWGPFAASFRGVRPGWLAAGLWLYLLLQALSGWRWWLLAGAFGFPRPLRRLTAVYFLGMYCNLLLPTSVGGDVVRAWYLDAGQGRRMAALLCVLVDRLLGLLVLLALACAAAALAVRDLPAWVAAGVWCLSAGVFAGLLAAPWLSRVTGRLLERRSGPGFRPGRAARLLYLLRRTATVPAGVVGGLLGLRRQPGVLAWALAGSLVIQAGNVAVVWAAARALNADVPVLALAVAVPVVSFLTLLPVSVNGMGVREAGMGVI